MGWNSGIGATSQTEPGLDWSPLSLDTSVGIGESWTKELGTSLRRVVGRRKFTVLIYYSAPGLPCVNMDGSRLQVQSKRLNTMWQHSTHTPAVSDAIICYRILIGFDVNVVGTHMVYGLERSCRWHDRCV
jgi:hypothetical protein